MWRIPLSDINFDHRESEAVQQVLDSGWLTMGPRCGEFEDRFAEHHNAIGAVAVTNCTCALELAYRFILQMSSGKRAIVVPDITFVATANAVISAGGTPLLCDIESPDRPLLSAKSLEELLKNRIDIAAVVLVHYAGYDAGAENIARICEKYKVHLVEDCAHSPSARTQSGKPLGTLGLAGCFSFFSNKNLATGEGGMIVSNHEPLLAWAKMARSHGVTSGTWTRHETKTANYDVMFPGHNYRCTEIIAALGLVQLEKLADGNARRRELTRLYADYLNPLDGVRLVTADETTIADSDCHILPVVFDNVELRGKVIEALTHASIQMSHHYRAIHTFAYYEKYPEFTPALLENSTSFAARQLTLPLHPKLKNSEVREICDTIGNAIP